MWRVRLSVGSRVLGAIHCQCRGTGVFAPQHRADKAIIGPTSPGTI